MNKQLVENILDVIKTSTDKAVIVKALLKLRTDLVKDRDGIVLFRESGGIAPMVRLLNKPHEKILEIVLSILGNCCTDDASAKEAFECKCVSPLTTILKSIPNPVIQCRACRLLGNLAKCNSTQLLATHCLAIAQSVCQIIVDTSDVQTRIMAFRACRFLLDQPQFLKDFLNSKGFISLLRILAAVMKNDTPRQEEQLLKDKQATPVKGLKECQHREKYFEEVARNLEGVRSDIFDHEMLKRVTRTPSNTYVMPEEKAAADLACEILKCLLVMSELQIGFSAWESLNCSGCSLEPVVFFITAEHSKHRGVALKILSNFGKNRGAFNILSCSDAIVDACQLLANASDTDNALTESERRYCITIICALSPDACNRSKIRRSGALRKLIAMMRDSKSQTEISSILYLLNFFEFDNMSLELMLRDGLIPVLIKELNAYLTSDDEYYKKRREERQQSSKKRKLPERANETSVCKFARMHEESPLPDGESPSSSPRSYNSLASPCSSRGMSPVGNHSFKLDDAGSDDEKYSPVCSDDDDDITPSQERMQNAAPAVASSPEEFDIMKLLETGRNDPIEDNMSDKLDDDDTSQDTPPSKVSQNGNISAGSIDIIENLLFRATLLVTKRGELGKPETLKTLIKAISQFGASSNFAMTLSNILLESQFFAQVITYGIPHQLHQLTKLPEMRKDVFTLLENLTAVGESNYGKAELARFLRTDNDVAAQKRAAIGVAYIIKNHRLLYQFLNDGNALAVLLNTILSSRRDDDEYTAEAVSALTSMARNTLCISVPQNDVAKRSESVRYKEDCNDDAQPLECDMRFIVHTTDDAKSKVESVAFNKKLLCDSSEVFKTMLTSDFREGNEGEIHLRECTVSGLKYFLNLVVRHAQQLKPRVPTSVQYHVLLESFEMTRFYMIPDLEEYVLELLIGLLDASNCLNVLEWSVKNYHAELMEMAINFYLCAPLSVDAKVQLYRTADYSTYSKEWFDMIFEAVLVRCRNGI